jgi:hypothetical protein
VKRFNTAGGSVVGISCCKLPHISAVVLALMGLNGCGEGYVVNPAQLNVNVTAGRSEDQILAVLSGYLGREGFEYLGKYQDMISLIQHGSMPAKVKQQELARLNRERTFLNRPRQLRIILADYSNGDYSELEIKYKPPFDHFVEICVFEERPGGFSSDGFLFYDRLLSALQKQFGSDIVVVTKPPPTNDAEYRRITYVNTQASILGWLIAAFLPLAFTGTISVRLLRKRAISAGAKRLSFVLVNTWLVTPLPFQGGYIFEFPGPNLLAFPWADLDYYRRVRSFAAMSFPCALLLCVVVSLFLFKANRASTGVDAHVPA